MRHSLRDSFFKAHSKRDAYRKCEPLLEAFEGETMKSRLIIAPLLVLLFPLIVLAQDPKEDFFAAARKGDIEALKALMAKGVDVNSKTNYGATALFYACDRGNTAVVQFLIEKGADVNTRDTFYNTTPIIWAAQRGFAEVVKLLLDHGANGSKDQFLMMGVEGHYNELVKLMLDRGGILPETLSLALKEAEDNKWADTADLLKKAGAKPAPKADFKVDEATLKTYEGVYKNEQVGELTFVVKDGKFTGRLGGQDWFTTAAIDKNTFNIVEAAGATIKFNSEGEKVVGLTLKQVGNTFEFKRVEQK